MKSLLLLLSALALTAAAVVSTSVFYDFSEQTEYWTYAGGWTLRDNGVGGSTAGWGFNLTEDDFLASPPVGLTAGETYQLSFRLDASGSNRDVGVAINTAPALGADTLLSVNIDGTEDFATLFTVPFTPTTTGGHHIVFFADGGTGFRKIIVDDVTLNGAPLNQFPLAKLTYPEQSATVLAEGARFAFTAEALDNDGSVSGLTFDVDGAAVDADNQPPFTGEWPSAAPGVHQLTTTVTDNEGATYVSRPLTVDVRPNPWNASYLGGSGPDDIRGSAVQTDGSVVLAANLSELPAATTPVYLNGATPGMRGSVLRLDPDGQTVLSVSVVGQVVADLATDDQNRIYVAAGPAGLLRLAADGVTLDYARPLPQNAHRVAATPGGYAVALSDEVTDYDNVKLLDARVIGFDPAGVEIVNTSGATTFTTDVAIDETTQTVYSTGYKNFRTNDGDGGTNLPVDVPAIKANAFDGTQRFRTYNWVGDVNSPNWLNRPENNMADTRGARLTVGRDGLLYVAFEADGGNHCLRYSPLDVTQPVDIVGGDEYSEFFNSGTEPKLFVGRYDPLTGDYLRGQQFCARLTNTAANTVRSRNGDLVANAAGEVFVVGESASGIPITLEYQPGAYRGGAYVLHLSADFAERKLVTRLTRGKARTVALGPSGELLFAGSTENEMFVSNALQANAGGGFDGWFAVEPSAPLVLPVSWSAFTARAAGKASVVLNWSTAAETAHRGFRVERAPAGGPWATVSALIGPAPGGRYTFTDTGLEAGAYRYRIRQEDVDGRPSYSATRTVRLAGHRTVRVYPNPAGDVLHVTSTAELATVDVFANGRRLATHRAGGTRVRLDLTELPAGLLLLRLVDRAGGEEWRRVVRR